MREEREILKLPEGDFETEVLIFEQDDVEELNDIYNGWRSLCLALNSVQARSVNLPEGLSETAFCLAKDYRRVSKKINGANSSFDCYDPNGERFNNRIQLKACSVLPDLTSFGPNSEWDRIYFADFYREGKWDGTFDVYEIDTNIINNYPVNRYQTVLDQKKQNRRPRFSIFSGLISKGLYLSKETFLISKNSLKKIDESFKESCYF